MIAFRLKSPTKLKTLLFIGFAVLCLLAIQVLGVLHEISHDSFSKVSVTSSVKINADSSFGHAPSVENCKLFDGLALSVVVTGFLFALSLITQFDEQYKEPKFSIEWQAFNCLYLTRAPPKSLF